MLTGKLVRVRVAKNRIHPVYIDVTDANWREVALMSPSAIFATGKKQPQR